MRNILKELNIDIHLVHKIRNATEENHHIPWRRLYDYEIIFVIDGEITVKTKRKTYTVQKNQVHIMQPFLYHTRYIPHGKSCTYYGLHLDFFSGNNDEFSIHDAYIIPIESKAEVVQFEDTRWLKRKRFSGLVVPHTIEIQDPKKLTSLFLKINHYAKQQSPYTPLLLKAVAYEITNLLFVECEKANTSLFSVSKNVHEDIIADFIEYVEHEYMHDIDLDALISSYGLSKNHFAKIFKQAMNIAPHDYIIDYRIKMAKTLIQEGGHYINEISEMVGYPDYSYFSRIFKRKEGVSPKNYLKQHKKS